MFGSFFVDFVSARRKGSFVFLADQGYLLAFFPCGYEKGSPRDKAGIKKKHRIRSTAQCW